MERPATFREKFAFMAVFSAVLALIFVWGKWMDGGRRIDLQFQGVAPQVACIDGKPIVQPATLEGLTPEPVCAN